MTDKYIDLDETQIYGPYAAKAIRTQALGLVGEFDAGLEKLAEELEHATRAIADSIEASRDASAAVRAVAKDKGPALKRAVGLLGRFSTHLDTHEKGSVDRKRFFPEDGTAGGVGKSAPRVVLGLGRIVTQLAKADCPVKAREDYLREFRAAAKGLAPQLEHSNNAKTERAAATPELDQARQAWLQVYAAAKCGVECVLRLTGNLHRMPTVFYDLTVPGNAKVTAAPEPPTAPGPGAPEEG